MRIKVKESFEYEVEVPNGLPDSIVPKYIWRIRDTLDYVVDAIGMDNITDGHFSSPEFTFDKLTWEKI